MGKTGIYRICNSFDTNMVTDLLKDTQSKEGLVEVDLERCTMP